MTTMVDILRDLVTRNQLRATFDANRKLTGLFATTEARAILEARNIEVSNVSEAMVKISRMDFDKFNQQVSLDGVCGVRRGMTENEFAMGLMGIERMQFHPQGRTGSEMGR